MSSESALAMTASNWLFQFDRLSSISRFRESRYVRPRPPKFDHTDLRWERFQALPNYLDVLPLAYVFTWLR